MIRFIGAWLPQAHSTKDAPMRFQLDISDSRNEDLESLMERCGISTKKELISYALSTLEWAVEETEKGNEVAAINRDDQKFYTLRMPPLDAVRRRAGK